MWIEHNVTWMLDIHENKNLKPYNSSTLATSCEELTHWKKLWCWEGLGAGGEGDDRGWDGWMASLTRWTWVWVNSGSWWWTGRSGMLWFMGSQRVGHDWAIEMNWTELNIDHGQQRKNLGTSQIFPSAPLSPLFRTLLCLPSSYTLTPGGPSLALANGRYFSIFSGF